RRRSELDDVGSRGRRAHRHCWGRVRGGVATRSDRKGVVSPTVHLDPRAWLLWLAAATLPLLMGRNPFPILAVFLVVIVIRTAWAPALHNHESWGGLRRMLVIIATISVVFNVLTAPIGDQVLVNLPRWWPL